MSRVIGCRVFFAWDLSSYTNESTNLVTAGGELRFAPPEALAIGAQGIVDRCAIELRNTNGRYSALNSSSPLYSNIQNGGAYHVPVYVDTTINDGTSWQRVFTGVTKIPKETGRAWNEMPTVRFECRSRDELLLQKRMSTTQAAFKAGVDTVGTEADAIGAILTACNVTGGARVLDSGLVPIQWAWMDDESPIEEIWQLAAAAGGRFYVDADGVYRYENAAHWLNAPHTTSVQTYTNADWKGFEARYEDRELYNRVTVEYASRQIDEETVIWQPDETVSVPAGGTRKVTATFSYPAYTQPTVTWKASTAGGTDVTSQIELLVTWYAQRAELTFQYKTGFTSSLQPALIVPLTISARVASGGPSADAENASVDSFWTDRGSRSRNVRGNVYVQSRGQAEMLATLLRVRHEKPRLFYTITGLLGNGARRPGDRITVNDVSVMSSAREAMVLAVRWRYGNQSYLMDLEAMDAAELYPYSPFTNVTPGYFQIGTSVMRDTAANPDDRGRLFY